MSINTAKLLHLSMPSHLGVHYIISEHIHVTVATWWAPLLTHSACIVHVFVLLVYHILWPEVSVTSG